MSSWTWPEANVAPASGDYVARHPTRYTWRVDVEEWARWLVDNYQGRVWCNTYYDHPEGYGRDLDSIDIWAYAGRGYPIERNVGDAVFNTLFRYKGEPQIDWIIWQATIYGAWNGWAGEPFGTDDFTWHQDHIHVTFKPNAGGGGGSPGSPLGEYPGNCADPEPFAHWLGYVAEKEFGLPPALPVMTVAVELTSALTAKGCLDDIPGFLAAQDHDSVGIMQQRPSQGWGTYEQCVDPEYALRKFCEEAEKLKDYEWHRDTTDPDALGRWCQAVQRSGVPNAYRDKGYPIAASLLRTYTPEPGPGPGPEPGPSPGPSPGPDPDIGIDVDEQVKEQIKKWGLYYFGSDSDQNWNLTYQPASGKSTPIDPGPSEPELHTARTKPQEVSYYVDENGQYVVVGGAGTEIRYSEDEFQEKYEEVE